MGANIKDQPPASALGRSDWRNLLLIGAGWLLCVLLMPPTRNFAYVDDWIYSNAVNDMLQGRGFHPPDLALVTLVSQVWWGLLFSKLFGYSFTALTWSVLVLSLVALIAFYLLLRQLGFASNLSLLGVAILGVNPLFFNYSYTYMTEVPLLACMLLSTLFYLKGLTLLVQESKAGNSPDPSQLYYFFLLGSLFASLAFLTRQFGLALPFTALLWLFWARGLTWQRVVAVALLPALTIFGYILWSGSFPITWATVYLQAVQGELFSNPVTALGFRAITLLYFPPLLGLTIFLFGRVRHWWLVLCWFVVLLLATYTVQRLLPQDIDGPPLNPARYQWLWLLGMGLAAWWLANLTERVHLILSKPASIKQPRPVHFIYLLTLILLLGTFVVSRYLYARYYLPVLPSVIVAGLLSSHYLVGRRLLVTWLLVALVGLYSVIDHLDIYAYEATQWDAGLNLVRSGVPINQIYSGFAWNGYFMYDEGLRSKAGKPLSASDPYPPLLVIDRKYLVTDALKRGYRLKQRYPYRSLLSFGERYVLVLERE